MLGPLALILLAPLSDAKSLKLQENGMTFRITSFYSQVTYVKAHAALLLEVLQQACFLENCPRRWMSCYLWNYTPPKFGNLVCSSRMSLLTLPCTPRAALGGPPASIQLERKTHSLILIGPLPKTLKCFSWRLPPHVPLIMITAFGSGFVTAV